MDLGLKGRIALVTGASKGLGFAAADLLAREGARVAINSRNSERLEKALASIKSSGGEAIALPGDVADPSVPDQLVAQTVQQLGGLDILIANAGGPPSGPFDQIDDDAWRQAVELSFLSNVRLIRAALPYLKQSATPAVLTVTSYSVKQPIPNLVLSNSIRAATVGLTKSLAMELGSEGIRFNSILPGWTETERVANLMSSRASNKGTSVQAEIAAQAAEIALGRLAQPEEFAAAAVFLVSPAASYITGVMLNVDGGVTKGLF